MPEGVTWIRGAAAAADPAEQRVTTESGQVLGYDYLVMAPGLQLNFGLVPGMEQALGERGVSSDYRYDLAPWTWEFIRGLRGGTALFTTPPGPVKCAGRACSTPGREVTKCRPRLACRAFRQSRLRIPGKAG